MTGAVLTTPLEPIVARVHMHTGAVVVELRCGCFVWYKASQEPSFKARCRGYCREAGK